MLRPGSNSRAPAPSWASPVSAALARPAHELACRRQTTPKAWKVFPLSIDAVRNSLYSDLPSCSYIEIGIGASARNAVPPNHRCPRLDALPRTRWRNIAHRVQNPLFGGLDLAGMNVERGPVENAAILLRRHCDDAESWLVSQQGIA